MSDLRELRQRRAQTVAEMEKLTNRSDWSATDRRRFDELKERAESLDEQLTALGQVEGMKEYLSRSANPAVIPTPSGTLNGDGSPGEAGPTFGQRSREFRSLFNGKSISPRNPGFASFNDFVEAVASGRHDERLLECRAMTGSVPSSGGYSVPTEWVGGLWDAMLEREVVRPRASVWPMNARTRKVPGWKANDHSSHLFGGLTATWQAEGGSSTAVDAKMREIELNAKRCTTLTTASLELVEDGLDFGQQLANALVATMSQELDYQCLRGDGSGKPLGVLNDPALIEVAAEGTEGSGTIVYENVTKMFARLHPACHQNAVWVANHGLIPSMLSMSVAVGTGGSVVPVLREESGRFFMLGKEVVFSEKMPATTAAGALLLCDFSQYALGIVSDISVSLSDHRYFEQNLRAFRCDIRADGQGMWDTYVTPRNSGDSLSWCVSIAARA